MNDPRARDWAWLLLLSFVILTVTSLLELGTIGYGFGSIIGLWGFVNFLHHAGVIAAQVIKEMRSDMPYRMSKNYTAELIKSMNKDQLKAWRLMGAAQIDYQVRQGRTSQPIEWIRGEDITLDFLNQFLDGSNERTLCPISNFFANTYHWDPTGEHLIDDNSQAKACTLYIVRNGWAEWGGNGHAATWTVDTNGIRWTADDIKRIHGLTVDEEE